MYDDHKQLELAVERGDLSPAAYRIVDGIAVPETRGGVEVYLPDSPEVVFAAMLIDDSYSIKHAKNTDSVMKGHNAAIPALKEAIQASDMLVRTQYMKGFVLNDWVPLDECREMNQANYAPADHTPLYDSTILLLRSLVTQVEKAGTVGRVAQSSTLIVSDGKDEGSSFKAADVREVVKSLLRTRMHFVSFMGIDDGHTDYRKIAQSMGIGLDEPHKWIITPDTDPQSIRRAFETWSKQRAR